MIKLKLWCLIWKQFISPFNPVTLLSVCEARTKILASNLLTSGKHMKHIKKASSYSMVGSLGLTVVAGLQGCGEAPQDMAAMNQQQETGMENLQNELQEQNYFMVIEQTSSNPDRYQLAERYPTEAETRAILRGMDGKETILSNAELKAIAEAEAQKVEEGTSGLLQQPNEASAGGLSLGEMVLASAAGALIGGMLANKLAGNANYQQHQKTNTRPSARVSQKATPRSAPSSKQKAKPKSGFFGGNRAGSSSSSSPRSFGG